MLNDFLNCRKAKKKVKAAAKAIEKKRGEQISKLGKMREGLLIIKTDLEKLKGDHDATRRAELPHST